MGDRAATRWAVIAKKPGVWTKRLLLPFDDDPTFTVATFPFEHQAERDIRTRENVFKIEAEQRGKTALLFAETPTGDLVAPDEIVQPAEATERKNDRTDIALAHADPEWKARAWKWIEALRVGANFTSDSLTISVGMPKTHPSGVGALFNAAARAGLVKKTGSYVQSVRKTCNGAIIAVWTRVEVQREPRS